MSSNVSQVSDADLSVTVEPVQQPRRGDATVQLSSQRESASAEVQLTNVRSSNDQPTQLSTGPRSAQPPQALSRPSEGRTAAVERVEGTDRCDASLPKTKLSSECSQVIETRADDYARPPPTELSPEQHLLLDQQLQTVENGLTDVTRRLARSGDGDTSIESQAVASIVLAQGQPPPKPVKPLDDPSADAATQAVLQMLSIAPPQN
jgi:hypothetical protein